MEGNCMEKYRVDYEVAGKKKHAVVSAQTKEQAKEYAERMLQSIYPQENSVITVTEADKK